jgi:hypothetical protein
VGAVRPALRALGCIAVLALTAAACGGGGGDGGPTAEEFAAAGNEICTDGDEELAKANDAVLKAQQARDLDVAATAEFFAKTVLPIARDRLDALSELAAPPGDAQLLRDMVAAGRDAVDEISEGLRTEGAEFLTASGPNPFAEFDVLAAELGLSRCVGRQEETSTSG